MLETGSGVGGEGRVPFGSRFAVDNAPGLGLAKIFGNLLEERVVMLMGAGGELAEGDSGVANVGTAGDIGIQEFTKEGAISKTLLGGKLCMFRSAFNKTSGFVHRGDSICGERSRILGSGRLRRRSPAMGAKDTIKVRGAGEDNGVIILVDINAIEFNEKAQVLEGWSRFRGELEALAKAGVEPHGKCFVGAGKSKVINLAEEEDTFPINDSRVDRLVMGGVPEAKLRGFEDAVDVGFPQAAGLRVSLEGMEDREDLGSIQWFLEFVFIPVSIGIVNGDKGRSFRRR